MNKPLDNESPAQLLHELARESLVERRRARRWSIFFRSTTLLLAGAVAVALLGRGGLFGLEKPAAEVGDEHTALIRIEGVIASDTPASLGPVQSALKQAFADVNTRGIILQINSPGGSPVQSGLVYDAIVAQREAHPDIPVHAVISDVAASGGYYVAAAAENIYANRASIVGSIGVLLSSFGAVEAMEQLGIERRLLTAGEHKGLLDPFQPTDEVAVARLQSMLENVHSQFIEAVMQGRGSRLGDNPELFSGLVWSGEEAVSNGLIDALASTLDVARDVVGAETIVDFTQLDDPLTRLRREFGVAAQGFIKDALQVLLQSGSTAQMQ